MKVQSGAVTSERPPRLSVKSSTPTNQQWLYRHRLASHITSPRLFYQLSSSHLASHLPSVHQLIRLHLFPRWPPSHRNSGGIEVEAATNGTEMERERWRWADVHPGHTTLSGTTYPPPHQHPPSVILLLMPQRSFPLTRLRETCVPRGLPVYSIIHAAYCSPKVCAHVCVRVLDIKEQERVTTCLKTS